MEHYRPTRAEISIENFQHNILSFLDHLSEECELMSVVKADAYGHGLIPMAQAALNAGASRLGVAIVEEAIELRNAGIKAPILVFGYTPPEAVQAAIERDITLTVFTEDVVKNVIETAETLQKQAQLHIKVDSGMHRIGLKQVEDVLHLLHQNTSPFIKWEGIFTHFSDADGEDPTYTEQQFEHFLHVVETVESSYGHMPVKHCCNSAATIAYPSMHLDMVRVGVSLYGLYPNEHMEEIINLKQVMSLKTAPVMIKTVRPGEPISYGKSFEPETPSKIATLPVGYADGWSRSLSNQGEVTIDGQRAPIVGKVCMDQTMIDVTHIEEVKEVTLFGDRNEGAISMQEVAEHMNTIHYEVACLIGKRVPRIYK
ncbi:alanine racemase [Halobacillus mangrovi]|uniref:alanine racemase n=1 Tax=Halobacillus mangrovi TaxID=402384 RepID=UPI003D993C2A